MDIMDSMKHTLQSGNAKAPKVASVSERTSGWRIDFWNPMNSALHLGTPKPSLGPVGPVSSYGSRTFID